MLLNTWMKPYFRCTVFTDWLNLRTDLSVSYLISLAILVTIDICHQKICTCMRRYAWLYIADSTIISDGLFIKQVFMISRTWFRRLHVYEVAASWTLSWILRFYSVAGFRTVINGRPLTRFKSGSYVRSWLLKDHTTASDSEAWVRSMKDDKSNVSGYPDEVSMHVTVRLPAADTVILTLLLKSFLITNWSLPIDVHSLHC